MVSSVSKGSKGLIDLPKLGTPALLIDRARVVAVHCCSEVDGGRFSFPSIVTLIHSFPRIPTAVPSVDRFTAVDSFWGEPVHLQVSTAVYRISIEAHAHVLLLYRTYCCRCTTSKCSVDSATRTAVVWFRAHPSHRVAVSCAYVSVINKMWPSERETAGTTTYVLLCCTYKQCLVKRCCAPDRPPNRLATSHHTPQPRTLWVKFLQVSGS